MHDGELESARMVTTSVQQQLATNLRRVTARHGWLLAMAAGEVDRRISASLTDEKLSVEQWRVLEFLAVGGPCPMSTLAGATGINGATLTRIVDRLVSRALVYRSADSADRRHVLIHVSARGRSAAERVRPLVAEAEDEALQELSAEDREQLMRLLGRLGT